MKVKDIVEKAVREYNNTIRGKNQKNLALATHYEKRGIFYNALRRQFQYSGISSSTFSFDNRVSVESIVVKFREDGTLEKFSLSDREYFPYNMSEREKEIYDGIKLCCDIQYLDTESHVDLSDIKNFQFKP